MFEKATRLKLRFDTVRGSQSVEDLWDLPLTTTKPSGLCLDQVAIDLNRQIKTTETESFVTDTPKVDTELQLRFDIVKHIIEVKRAENAAARDKADRAGKKARLLEIMARKQNEALEGKSLDELQAEIDAL